MRGVPLSIWYFDSDKPRRVRRGIYSHHKVFLYELVHRSITRHNVSECWWALKLLPRLTTMDPYVLFRFLMIMINSVETEKINKNFIIYLESLLSQLNLSKPDIFVEFLTYFLGNNRIDDARELFNQRHRFMSYLYHRKVPLINVNIRCYEFLFNYLDWQKRLPTQKEVKFDVSIQGWLVNAMDPLKKIDSNYEFFIMCIANVLLYYGFHKKAYLFLSEFQRSNPDNIAAQLLLYNLISNLTSKTTPKRIRTSPEYYNSVIGSVEEKNRNDNRLKELDAINNFSVEECNTDFELEKYPIISDKRNIYDNLLRLDPRRDEVLSLSVIYSNKLDALQLIMDSLEYVSEIRSATRWRYLQDILNEILSSNDEEFISNVRSLWQTRYQAFWRLEDFLALAVDKSTSQRRPKHKKIIKSVMRTLSSKFDSIEETVDSESDGDHDIEWD